MADGSQGWRVNCADLPVAAASRPAAGTALVLYRVRASWKFKEVVINQVVVKIRPTSPIRL